MENKNMKIIGIAANNMIEAARKLEKLIFCEKCDNLISEYDKVCGECGKLNPEYQEQEPRKDAEKNFRVAAAELNQILRS